MWLANVQTQRSIATLLGMSFVAISFTGCASLGWSKPGSGILPVEAIDTRPIASVKQAPQVNAIVQIKGRVSNRAPLLGKSAYELQDTTGSLWVLTTDSIPSLGDEVVLKGKLLYRSIPLNGQEQGSLYIEQQQELQRTPATKSDRRG
jgi:hypothetical protein